MFDQMNRIEVLTIICIVSQLLFVVYGKFETGDLDDDLFEGSLNVTDVGNHIREIMEHFKKSDPVGLPGTPIPDPMPTPDMKYTKSLATLNLKKSMIHGLSKFRIDQIQSNLDSLQVVFSLTYEKVEVLGNYTISTWVSKSQGGYNVTILDVTLGGVAKLDTARDGHLEVSEIFMDLAFKDIKMDFKNVGFLLTVFQGMMNHVGGFVFDTIKPYILSEVNTNIKADINKMMSRMKKTFPNSIPPLDLAIAEGRKYVRESGFDPYSVPDYQYSTGIFSVEVKDIVLSGLSSFYRVGNITVAIRKNTLIIDSHISTLQLEGKCNWEASVGQMFSTYGSTGFTVQYLQVQTKLNQSLDVRNKPNLEEINLRLGNFQLRMDGMGTLDYGLELIANVLPNILRFQIVDAIEGVLKQRIQTILGALDVEENIEKYIIANLDTVIAPNQTINELESSYEITDNPFDIDELYDEITF